MCVAADIPRHQWHTSQHIFCSANIQAGPCQVLVSNENSENLEDRLLIQHDFLSFITFFPKINHLCITLCNLVHQPLMHVMIYVLRVKVWVMQNFLDEVLNLFYSSLILLHMLMY
jgi:hypothetical protein